MLDGSEPIFVLVIGSDARPDQAVESQRADSIHILAINPAKHKATIVGIPRDALADIPSTGRTRSTRRCSSADRSSSSRPWSR